MDILGDRKFVEVPGEKTHELPPLLVSTTPKVKRLDRVMGMATDLIESEDMMAAPGVEGLALDLESDRRRMDLAINLSDQYLRFVTEWQWGDGILEWIRQCEMTFGARLELRNLLRPDVWPHAGRRSFVNLLEDKAVSSDGVTLEKAVGLRLTFRQPPPLSCFSNQFLYYLNAKVAGSAYDAWSNMTSEAPGLFPPDRFHFQVLELG